MIVDSDKGKDPDNTVHAAADPPHNVDQAGSTSTAGHTTALDHDSPMIDTFTANDSRGNDAADPANFPPKPFINSTNDPMDIDGILPKEYPVNVHSVRSELDLVHSIKGMYRLLDLYSENGSGGLVDKVIIDQDSISKLINNLSPGAYISLTKINFAALDQQTIRPLGVYGSKVEIVKLLTELGAVDSNMATLLLTSPEDTSGVNKPSLRSGLYFLLSSESEHPLAHVIYWPESTTWNDDAISAVHRNRVTFMRYLTKLTDQVIGLISEEHANRLVWNNVVSLMESDIRDDDEFDRLFPFEVQKTHEQTESVSTLGGFKLKHSGVSAAENINDLPMSDILNDLQPRLAAGETRQGFLSARFVPARGEQRVLNDSYASVRLRHVLKDMTTPLYIDEHMPYEDLRTLIDNGLDERVPLLCTRLAERIDRGIKETATWLDQCRMEFEGHNETQRCRLHAAVLHMFQKEVGKLYPQFRGIEIVPTAPDLEPFDAEEYLQTLRTYYLNVVRAEEDVLKKANLGELRDDSYRDLKKRFTVVRELLKPENGLDLDDSHKADFPRFILMSEDIVELVGECVKSKSINGGGSRLKGWFLDLFSSTSTSDNFIKTTLKRYTDASDPEFIAELPILRDTYPNLAEAITELERRSLQNIKVKLESNVHVLVHKIQQIQEKEWNQQRQREKKTKVSEHEKDAVQELSASLCEVTKIGTSTHGIRIERVEKTSKYSPPVYRVRGVHDIHIDAYIEYTIYPLEFTENDKQSLQMDPAHVPTPVVQPNSLGRFSMAASQSLRHVQLLNNNKCLIIIDDAVAKECRIYVEDVFGLGQLSSRHPKKNLKHDKLGPDFVTAIDEEKRVLAIFSTAFGQCHLYIFLFDELFSTLQARGSPINLQPWYEDGAPTVRFLCFISGTEEMLLLEDSGRGRIFSMVTQQFRPASLHLNRPPTSIFSAPDGSCLFCIEPHGHGFQIRAFHWASFGKDREGVVLDLPYAFASAFSITSLSQRSTVHLVCLSPTLGECDSVAFKITRKTTEFMFRAQGGDVSHTLQKTMHNSLMDCFSDVWTRFPVVPAIQRMTISSSGRKPPAVLFVSDRDHEQFSPYFRNLIRSFEASTRKPTNGLLDTITVTAKPPGSIGSDDLFSNVSEFKGGEWLVELFCLLPIHIAVTGSNRFLPLKDGIQSPDFERSLLGADLERIVDSLSIGWYESIFRSYMATKPVKVVTSMGEQSVGKSFALNHLVDTSFAGSAMRCTEGVWLSCTPTQNYLIVALDFEGVHSIERSAQEDTLLVLFNAALSNLVLFRNNFALSRDIAGLFTSFQSSSSVLDPASNPTLFQSTLAIIIKDVIDSDAKEIVKEFSLKFQRIVQDEKDNNFISKLHRGRLDIIPWPVIESPRFYTLLGALKRRLEAQVTTYHSAGAFLYTLKTLMAKLKVCDWGALDQSLASHRAHQLLETLPTALSYGVAELEPVEEPLKDFDTDIVVPHNDGSATFYSAIAVPVQGMLLDKDNALLMLRASWTTGELLRQSIPEIDWMSQLSSHLHQLADRRLHHVASWLDSNLIRFPNTHPDVRALRRAFDESVAELQSNIELCGMSCASCLLLCPRRKQHGGPHDCGTSHRCLQTCDFTGDHIQGPEHCGFPASHLGRHICDASLHLCGQSCAFNGKSGCLEKCTLPVDHMEDEHLCSARTHRCGELCSLSRIKTADDVPLCSGKCVIECQDVHEQHICENRLSCPRKCALCQRLCAAPDHFHALVPGAFHLCGQEHTCPSLCRAPGICEIATAPHSIESTFIGRHETFQFTKYTQVAKRLPCVVPIPSGELSHSGSHTHTVDAASFHFCEERCPSCFYLCTLPLGHPQQEHDTSHGSMSLTEWAIDGNDGTVLELQGRKFASGDAGAPMLCSLVCKDLGRHAHIDYCRATASNCPPDQQELYHIDTRMNPQPDVGKDWITHRLFWARSGFRDPYSRDEQAEFTKCDALCGGTEHAVSAGGPAHSSYCALPIFHKPATVPQNAIGTVGYISNDGHSFLCKNPALLHQAFHVMFVIDKSGSMGSADIRPLQNSPVTTTITRHSNNRFGAVLSALYNFWAARHAAYANSGSTVRRDAYTIILFDHRQYTCLASDFSKSPDELLATILRQGSDGGGTDFAGALRSAQTVMEDKWSNERTPVVIFLSDGECSVPDNVVYDLCRRSVGLGKPLSFHSVSFGPEASSTYLRRMVQIATEVAASAPRDPLAPVGGGPGCSYTRAIDTIQLAETFLGLAESLRKPRASLVRTT